MLITLLAAAAVASSSPSVEERGLADLSADLAAGRITSEALTKAYLARIAAIDKAGPTLHSILALNPDALANARAVDRARAEGLPLPPLAGIPVLVKDNIETADEMATTAGSLALADNITHRDAPLVAHMRAAGLIILGKTNLSEWANIRSSASISGWSALGGLVRNPYALDRSVCGSSSGTGAAIAASLAAAGVGTETDGSITCPSSLTGLVGLKPTVGRISRTYVVPISHSQDTPGPMARSVLDAALLLNAMVGADDQDPATKASPQPVDFSQGLATASLKGVRLGILRGAAEAFSAEEMATFDATLNLLRAQGAVLVEITDFHRNPALGADEDLVLKTELKADLNAYLATAAPQVQMRTLAQLIGFNAKSPREMVLFGQDYFEAAEQAKGLDDPAYLAARARAKQMAGPEGIDRLLVRDKLDALIAPSYGPAWRIDVVTGDHDAGGIASVAAVAGYPHLTVPMGAIRGLPIGLSFVGPAWSEAKLLQMGAAFERATQARHPPSYLPSLEDQPDMKEAFAPASKGQ